jgi:hypothetical protein
VNGLLTSGFPAAGAYPRNVDSAAQVRDCQPFRGSYRKRLFRQLNAAHFFGVLRAWHFQMLSRYLTSDPRTKFFYQRGDGLPTMGKLPKPDFAGTTKKLAVNRSQIHWANALAIVRE